MMRRTQKLSFITFFLLCSSIFLILCVAATTYPNRHHHHHYHAGVIKKLFVFGDSYADTGNNRKSIGTSWKEPYGITFPGKPSGRFSDGRVLTDFLARSLGLRSPVAYRLRKYCRKKLKYGMNFAYGGTGVFDTSAPYPNMTTQIDFFQHMLQDNVFTPVEPNNSVALISLAGNDYSFYLDKGGSLQELQAFISQVVTQLVWDIERIYKLGVGTVAVTTLEPLGCLPRSTNTNSYQQCNSTYNQAVSFHNLLLKQAVAKLNNQTHDQRSPIFIIDLYDAFFSVIRQRGDHPGSWIFNDPLKPCCMGINENCSCGSVDAMGNKMYWVCPDPKSAFFWDNVHPTQAGWHAVSSLLRASLEELSSV